MEVKIGLQPEIQTVVYTGLDQHWLKWGSEIKVEILFFPKTNKTFYICTDLKDKTKVCTVTPFMFKYEPLDKKIKTTEVSWSRSTGLTSEVVEKFYLLGTEKEINSYLGQISYWMEERYSVESLDCSVQIVEVPLCKVIDIVSPNYPYMLNDYSPEEYFDEHF